MDVWVRPGEQWFEKHRVFLKRPLSADNELMIFQNRLSNLVLLGVEPMAAVDKLSLLSYVLQYESNKFLQPMQRSILMLFSSHDCATEASQVGSS